MSRILIVDDSSVMRDGLARLLEKRGYVVSTAEDGKAGFCMLYADLPDLIVLDLMMPEMSGLMFLRMLRAHDHWRELPVLILTGLAPDEALVQDARSFGVVDVIRKGGDMVDLLLHQIDVLFPKTRKRRSNESVNPPSSKKAAGRLSLATSIIPSGR